MTISALAAGVAGGGLALHVFSAAIAAFRCRRGGRPLAAPADAPPVAIVQPLCGIEAFSKETLASIFALRSKRERIRDDPSWVSMSPMTQPPPWKKTMRGRGPGTGGR